MEYEEGVTDEEKGKLSLAMYEKSMDFLKKKTGKI